MIYLFYGSDTAKARTQAFAFAEAARKKQPNLTYVRLAREELSPATLEEIAESGGLFVQKLLVLLDDPFPSRVSPEDESEAGSAPIVEESLDALAKSPNVILILAPKISAAKAKKIEAKAQKSYRYDLRALPEARGFNGALVNALAARKREGLWLEVVRALRAGDAPEMIHGLLHWKARDLLAKGGRAWRREDARALSLNLIALLQESRRTGADLSASLEKFALLQED